MQPPRRYFFVHLQKTAGTALLRRLRHQFGVERVYPRPAEQGTPATVLDVDLLRRRLRDDGGELRAITGHFPLATVDLLDGPMATFTVLRDPVERVLSFLRHQREVDPGFARHSLEEVYAAPIGTGALVRNHMTRMLSLTSHEMTEGALTPIEVDDRRLERACEALADHIDVMGLQDRFDTFCSDLEEEFGWNLGEPIFMNRTQEAPASGELRERIASDNDADMALYEFAVDLWRRKHPEASGGG